MAHFEGFKPGEIIDGRYEIIDTIGKGGFGVVYRARQIAVDRVVALKVLLPDADTVDPLAVERFRREAVLISSLESANTITLYEFGQTKDDLLYTVMEFARGETLRQVLERQGNVDAQRTHKIATQVLGSLHEAHQRGVVHRDLKPANIMIGEYAGKQDHVKVLDFGIAKILTAGDTQSTLALTGRIVGTPKYMAPEQLRGVNPTPACDLYAVGLVLFELLTGKPAVVATETMAQVQAQLMDGDFVVPQVPGVPIEMISIINRALLKDSNERFQTAEIFSKALDGAMQARPAEPVASAKTFQAAPPIQSGGPGVPIGGPTVTSGASSSQVPTSSTELVESSNRGLGSYILLAALFFLLALGGVAFMLLTDPKPVGDGPDAGLESDVNGSADSGQERVPDRTDIREQDLGSTSPDLTTVSITDTGSAPSADAGVNPVTVPDLGTTPPVQVDAAPTPSQPDAVQDLSVQATPDVVATPDVQVEPEPIAVAEPDQEEIPVVAEVATVSLQITSEPTNVRLYIDDEQVGRTPHTIEVPADGTSVPIRLRSSGYRTDRRDVSSEDSPGPIHVRLRERERERPQEPVIPLIE